MSNYKTVKGKKAFSVEDLLKGAKLLSPEPQIVTPEFKNKLRAQLEEQLYGKNRAVSLVDKVKGFFNINITKPALFGMGMLTSFFALVFLLISFGIPNDFSARASLLDGNVQIKAFSKSIWVQLTSDTVIYEGDELRTDPDARAEITLADGSKVRMDGDSQFRFLTLRKSSVAVHRLSGNLYHSLVESQTNYKVVVDDYEVMALASDFTTYRLDKNFRIKVIANSVKIQKSSDGEEQFAPQVIYQGNKYERQGLLPPYVAAITNEEAKSSFLFWNRELELAQGSDLGFLAYINLEDPTDNDTQRELLSEMTAEENEESQDPLQEEESQLSAATNYQVNTTQNQDSEDNRQLPDDQTQTGGAGDEGANEESASEKDKDYPADYPATSRRDLTYQFSFHFE